MAKATFDYWMNTPYWKTAMSNHGKFDVNEAENWTGGKVGVGVKSFGKYEVSPAAYTATTGIVATPEFMEDLTVSDAKEWFEEYFFDKFKHYDIDSQEVGALMSHIQAHYGNSYVSQQAFNALGQSIPVDGVTGPMTIEACNKAIKTHGENVVFNAIRKTCLHHYSTKSPAHYRAYFVKSFNTNWPQKSGGDGKSNVFLIVGVSVAALLFIFKDKVKKWLSLK